MAGRRDIWLCDREEARPLRILGRGFGVVFGDGLDDPRYSGKRGTGYAVWCSRCDAMDCGDSGLARAVG